MLTPVSHHCNSGSCPILPEFEHETIAATRSGRKGPRFPKALSRCPPERSAQRPKVAFTKKLRPV